MNNPLFVKLFGGRRGVLPAAVLFALGHLGPGTAAAEPPRIASLGVRNAASFGFAGVVGGGIAPGSIFAVFGADLGPETAVHGAIPFPDSLPADAMGTRVEFRSLESGTTVTAFLLFTSASQVMGILPSEMPLGPAEVTVSYLGETSAPRPVNILRRAVGIFTQNMDGRGQGVIQNVVSATDQPLNQLTRPALPGQYIVLWATGLGAIDAPDNVEPPVGNVAEDIEVEIGGVRMTASYAGRAPGFPGVDQINVPLPANAEFDDCYVNLIVWAGDRPSQQVAFSAAPEPRPCKHPYGLSSDTLADLDAGGRVSLGQLRISRHFQAHSPDQLDASPSDFGVATGGFFSVDSGDLAVFASQGQPGLPQEELGCHNSTPASPNAVIISGDFSGERFEPVPASRIRQLDAGESLELLGPGEQRQEMRRLLPAGESALVFDYTTQLPNPDGSCCAENLPGEFLVSGEWTIEGSGGEDVGAFQASLALPPFPEIELPQSLNREQDQELSWASEGYGETDRVLVGIGGPMRNEENGQTTISAQVLCGASAASGRITVPASLMREAVTSSGERPGMWFVTVTRPEADTAVFSAPGIDHGTLVFNFGEYRPVDIE